MSTGFAGQPDNFEEILAVFGIQLIAMAIYLVVYCWSICALANMATRQVMGEQISVRDAFNLQGMGISAFGTVIVIGIVVSIGCICCLPGVILMGLLIPTLPLMFAQRMGGFQAMSVSWSAMTPYLWPATGFAFIMYLLLTVGGMFCGLGLLATAPVYAIAFAWCIATISFGTLHRLQLLHMKESRR